MELPQQVRSQMKFGNEVQIVAYDADQVDRAEKAGRDGGIRSRTAEQLVMLRGGSLDVIERNGTDNEYGYKNI
jgi:hypothetical protein